MCLIEHKITSHPSQNCLYIKSCKNNYRRPEYCTYLLIHLWSWLHRPLRVKLLEGLRLNRRNCEAIILSKKMHFRAWQRRQIQQGKICIGDKRLRIFSCNLAGGRHGTFFLDRRSHLHQVIRSISVSLRGSVLPASNL